jgi:DNA modification methylase
MTEIINSFLLRESSDGTYREKLVGLLSGNLDFHGQNSNYASHNFHSFPAKFPPQLPRLFINELTNSGDTVLDPMMGSGTTILEAFLNSRYGVGLDIDPLALLISSVKINAIDTYLARRLESQIIKQAIGTLTEEKRKLEAVLSNKDLKTRQFIDYWFAKETQLELQSLILEIEKVEDPRVRAFFELNLSSIIITKSGGVSLALDLGHTRPHLAKEIINQISTEVQSVIAEPRPTFRSVKTLRSAVVEFDRKFHQNINDLTEFRIGEVRPEIIRGNSKQLPVKDSTIDLIVTSPPYAANAIDYMRAHKFSLVWFGHSIEELGQMRSKYIGSETTAGVQFEALPEDTSRIISNIALLDNSKGRSLQFYYSELKLALQEMYRVLKPEKAAIVVVGSSIIRGEDTRTAECLAEIGRSIGFEVPLIGKRNLDRNRRMMPAGSQINLNSQIQQRMHEEDIIGFYKPVKK